MIPTKIVSADKFAICAPIFILLQGGIVLFPVAELPKIPTQQFWTASRLTSFCRHAKPIEFAAGEHIFSPGEYSNYLYLIESGKVNMCHYSENGASIIVFQDGPGELLGSKGIFNSVRATQLFYAVAATDVKAWAIRRENFVVLLQEDFDFIEQVFARFALHMDILERKLLHSMTLSAHHRIVMQLLELSEQTSQRTTNTAVVFVTQQELSDMLSLSRQTTVVCLKTLQEKGILKTSRGQIDICNLENLRQEIL